MKVELFSPSIASPACGTRPGSEYAHVKRRGKGKAEGGGKNTLIPVTNAKQLAFWGKQQSLCDARQFPRWKHLKTPGWPTGSHQHYVTEYEDGPRCPQCLSHTNHWQCQDNNRKSNVLTNDTNSLTQLCLGSKAKMNQYLQKLLRTEKELEVASNNNIAPNHSEQDDERGKKVLQPWRVLCSLKEGITPLHRLSVLASAQLNWRLEANLHKTWVLSVCKQF